MGRKSAGINNDSDSSMSEESSDDSYRSRKRSSESQSIYEESKRGRRDNVPMTINHNDDLVDDVDSSLHSQSFLGCSQQSYMSDLNSSQRSYTDDLNSSQQSYTDDLNSSQQSYIGDLSSSQPSVLTNHMSRYSNQSDSDIVCIGSSQPSTTASYTQDSSHRVTTKGKRTTSNKKVTNGKQSQSSSQESNEAGVSDREKQKEKNRMYARSSREKKNQKMMALEQTNKTLKSIIEIYTKVIGIFYKRQNPKATLTWTNYHIQWYNNIDGESQKCQIVECLLPLQDSSFFEELGNTSLGTIIAKDVRVLCSGDVLLPDSTTTRGSDLVMTSNSGGVFTHRTISNPAPTQPRMPPTTHCQSALPGGPGNTQNTLSKLELSTLSTDCTDGRQNRNGGIFHFPTFVNTVKLEPNEMVRRGSFNGLQTSSSQVSIVSNDTSNLIPSRQITTNMNNLTIATTCTENISLITHPDVNFHDKRSLHRVSNFTGTQSTSKLGSNVTSATVNILSDSPRIHDIQAQNYVVSPGSNFSIAESEDGVYFKQSDPTFENTDDYLLHCRSSTESVNQETPEIEDLQFTLETA